MRVVRVSVCFDWKKPVLTKCAYICIVPVCGWVRRLGLSQR